MLKEICRASIWVCLLSLTQLATAETEGLTLTWNAPTGSCPDRDAVTRQVESLVGANALRQAPIQVEAHIEQVAPEHYRAYLTTQTHGAQGVRVLDEQSCDALSDVVVLIIAWMIQPALAGSDAEPRPPDAEPTTSPAPPKASFDPKRSTETAPQARVVPRWQISVRALADAGTLPSVAAGAKISVRYRLSKRFGAVGEAAFWPQSRAEVPAYAGFSRSGANFSLATAGLRLCYQPWHPLVQACVGPEVNRLRGSGFGVSDPAAGAKMWGAVATGLRSSLQLGSLWTVDTSAEVVLPLAREQYLLADTHVHRPSAVSGQVGLGLGAQF